MCGFGRRRQLSRSCCDSLWWRGFWASVSVVGLGRVVALGGRWRAIAPVASHRVRRGYSARRPGGSVRVCGVWCLRSPLSSAFARSVARSGVVARCCGRCVFVFCVGGILCVVSVGVSAGVEVGIQLVDWSLPNLPITARGCGVRRSRVHFGMYWLRFGVYINSASSLSPQTAPRQRGQRAWLFLPPISSLPVCHVAFVSSSRFPVAIPISFALCR